MIRVVVAAFVLFLQMQGGFVLAGPPPTCPKALVAGIGGAPALEVDRTHNEGRLIVVVNLKLKNKVSEAYVALKEVLAGLAPGAEIRIVHWTKLDAGWLERTNPRAVVLGPQGTPWWEYDQAALQPVKDAVLAWRGPLLGICGGHQFIALAAGARVAPMRCNEDSKGYSGCAREKGYTEVRVQGDDPLFEGVGSGLTVWENHVEEVKAIPDGFDLLGSTSVCGVQAFRRRGTSTYGVQFHPEVTTPEHREGLVVLRNFLQMAGLRILEAPSSR
ncbi:MAG: gamma-glutamyl-gamma-aminobutyrate hydrolase family protein [Pseudomonadota bacterium]